MPLGDFFACGWGKYAQVNPPGRLRESGQCLQLLLEHAVPQEGRMTLDEHLDDARHDAVLPDQLHADRGARRTAAYFHAQFRRVNPLPYKDVLHDSRRREGQGHYVGTYLAWECAQHRLVGRGRDQILHGRRSGIPHHLRHGYGGLLLRLVQLREPQTNAVPGPSAPPMPDLCQVMPPDGIYLPSSDSGCTAGISSIRFVSTKT